MKKGLTLETTSFSLHLMGMVFMLCDHLWGTVVPGNDWLTCVGRIALPIFAFLIVEGYFHTRDLKKYFVRMLLFAVISEIPFNLAMGSRVFYLIHQNVLWTFLIAMGLIWLNEKAKKTGKLWVRILTALGTLLLGTVLGLVAMVDYYHAGVLMVLAFYFFRGKKWWCLLGQLVSLWYINLEILGGYTYELVWFGQNVHLVRQGLALLALIPIWLYRGKQGYHSKMMQYLNYAFYPAHLLILGIIKLL